jgi:DNA primase
MEGDVSLQVSEEVIQKIKEQNDIVDIISEDVRLKKSGRNYMGLCPFHNDKSPSFSVSSEKQIYKCFSCGEAGNVFTFVMKYKKLTFVEAAKYLAAKANIPLQIENSENSKISRKKELLYKINVEAARYYFSNLQRNRTAKDYFLKRGIKEETIKRFGLGYSNDEWQGVINYLRKKGYKNDFLLEAGLVSKSEKSGNVYDKFRNRVMFPVFDVRGKVIGFGGRVLDDSKPKYLNSPETMVFQKGINLYGLNFAVKNKLQEDYIIIVEGYMDLIALHQYGITNAVASLGTALTVNQVRLLRRYVNKVIISYDADVAGQTATLRGLEILRSAGLDVKVLTVPEGKDPDEFVRNNGKDAFLRLINEALPLIDYKIKRAAQGIDLKNQNDLIEYGEKFAEILADLNPIEKDVYIKKISEETSIKEQALYDLLSQVLTKKQKEDNFVNKKGIYGTKLYVEPAYLKAERALLKLMLNDEFYDELKGIIKVGDFVMKSHNKIYSLILEGKNEDTINIESYIENRCDDVESSKELTKIKEHEILEFADKSRLISDYLKEVKKFKLKLQIDSLKKEQNKFEKEGKIEESIKIAIELAKLSKELKVEERG